MKAVLFCKPLSYVESMLHRLETENGNLVIAHHINRVSSFDWNSKHIKRPNYFCIDWIPLYHIVTKMINGM